MESPTTTPSRSARSSFSFQSAKSASLTRRTGHPHSLYSILPEKKDTIVVTSFEFESRFSSCSTSPNSSCESFAAPPSLSSSWQCRISNLSVTPSALSAALSRASSTKTSSSVSTCSRYADNHYPLIDTISRLNRDVPSPVRDMASAYNTYIRAINSCYNHALSVKEDEISDFLLFNQTLFNVLSQHLAAEQQYLQPLLHKPVLHPGVAIRKTVSIREDAGFQDSFHAWAKYVHDRDSHQCFSGEELQAHMSIFAPILVQHLHDEVDRLSELVSNSVLMPEHLSKIWSKFEEALTSSLDLHTDVVLLVGCHDKSFTINGQRVDHKFPRLPMGTTTITKKWHSRRYEGAWQFCSSDFNGKRRMLGN